MKKFYVFVFLLILLCAAAHAQKRTFLRLYSMAGNKFSKGHFYGTTDSSMLIYKESSLKEIAATNIGYIKTRRSLGHHVLVGALIGAIPASIIGAATTSKPSGNEIFAFTPGEAAVTGFFVGGVAGIGAGALVSAFTKSTTFTINGSLNEWRLQRKTIDLLPAYKK